MKLLGIDVGFSKFGDTTGVAYIDGDDFGVARATVEWASRSSRFPKDFKPEVVGVDAPLVPKGSGKAIRDCELHFSRKPFQHRCKPGLSHFGMGLMLRYAGSETRHQLIDNGVADYEHICEAFPNAFIAVLIPDAVFRNQPELKRGQKFDWLYDSAVKHDCFTPLFDRLKVPNGPGLRTSIITEKDHEHRAAWICLLTAWCIAKGNSVPVGDADGGWFWLPPSDLWQSWAVPSQTSFAEDFGKEL